MGAVCKYPDWIRRITEKVKNERGYGKGGGQKGKIFLCIALKNASFEDVYVCAGLGGIVFYPKPARLYHQ